MIASLCGPANRTKGRIVTDTAKEKLQEGEIVAAGPGATDVIGKLIPLDVRVGLREQNAAPETPPRWRFAVSATLLASTPQNAVSTLLWRAALRLQVTPSTGTPRPWI
jgi:hypothetical protein